MRDTRTLVKSIVLLTLLFTMDKSSFGAVFARKVGISVNVLFCLLRHIFLEKTSLVIMIKTTKQAKRRKKKLQCRRKW